MPLTVSLRPACGLGVQCRCQYSDRGRPGVTCMQRSLAEIEASIDKWPKGKSLAITSSHLILSSNLDRLAASGSGSVSGMPFARFPGY